MICAIGYILQFKDVFTPLTGAASSSQIVNSTLARSNCPIHSDDSPTSVNKRVIFSGRAKGVRSSFPNLEESIRANNCCDDSMTLRLSCASARWTSVIPLSRQNPQQERKAF